MWTLRGTRTPEAQADATGEDADLRRRPVTTEQFEATLHRALAIQAAVIITVIIVAQTRGAVL